MSEAFEIIKVIDDSNILFPKPTFATHCITTRGGYENVPKRMAIDMVVVGRPVSLSLDGTYAKEMRYWIGFAFDLGKLITRVHVKPAIYLTSKGPELVSTDEYYLQRWHYFYEAELLAEGTIPLQLAMFGFPGTFVYPDEVERVLSNVGIEYRILPQTHFRRKVSSTFALAQKCEIYPVSEGDTPSLPWLQDYLHGYNRMICGIFGLDYPSIIEDTEKNFPRTYIPF